MSTTPFPTLIVMGRLPSDTRDTRDTASAVLSYQLGSYYENSTKNTIYAAAKRMAREINAHGAPRIQALITAKRLVPNGTNNPDARPAAGFSISVVWPGGRVSVIR